MAKKKAEVDYAHNLKEEFNCWENLKNYGGSDPSWADGINMNLVRNHIIYYKQKIEEKYSKQDYPAIYFRETPPQVDDEYMARADEIRQNARKTLSIFEQDENLKLIKRKLQSMNPQFMKQISANNIAGYERGLKTAIAKDDLVSMRRYEYSDYYLSSFQSCADKIRGYTPPVNEQLTLFDCLDEEETFDITI